MVKTVGINKRISINVIEMAMKASLDGIFTSEYAADLASGEYDGPNRIIKSRGVIGKLTLRNPLFQYIEVHKDDYFSAIKNKSDRAIVFAALINASYGFAFDTMTILGKFFHVQEEVSSQLILGKMSTIYGSNRSVPVGLYCILPMYIESGMLNRPKTGIYTRNFFDNISSFSRNLYYKSFQVHNPNIQEEDLENMEHPYFEFIS